MQIGPNKQIIDPGSVVVAPQKAEPEFAVPEKLAQDENPIPESFNKPEAPKKEINSTMFSYFYDFLRTNVPLNGAYVTALGHMVASVAHILNLDSKDKADSAALNTSKTILSLNCAIQTIEAMKENRLWEGVSRFLEPLFIIAEKRVEDLGLARGIGLGISQLVESQDGVYKELCKKKLGIDIEDQNEKRKPSAGQDHDINLEACKKILKELFTGGLGKARRFMTGFHWQNMQKKLTAFAKQFNFKSFKLLFDGSDKPIRERLQNFYDASGLSHIKTLCVGNKSSDKGHTTALSGYMMILGSLVGYMDKASKGTFYKLGGSLRNLGGLVADVSIFGNPDTMHNLASPFLTVNGLLDIAQRFIPDTMTRSIKAIGNISMAFYNVGVAIYLNRSNDKTNEKNNIGRFDTDLNQSSNKKSSPAELMAMAA